MTDGAPFDRQRGLTEISQIETELSAVDEALVRLDDGTYGTCRTCGAVLPDDLMAADPLTDRCAAHVGHRSGLG